MRRYFEGKDPDYITIINGKYIGTQGVKIEKGDAEVPDPAIRVRILYKSDLTLHLFMVLVMNRNGESSLMFSITIKMYRICMCPINTRSRNLQTILKIKLRTIRLRLKSRELSLLYGKNMLSIFIISSLILRIAGIMYI